MPSQKKIAIIAGAGPAGLTAAYELLKKTDVRPIVLEKTGDIGGISKTVEYRGNRIDIGGHRFFSKSDTVMDWWRNIMPLQSAPSIDDIMLDRKRAYPGGDPAADPEKADSVLLDRARLSRIYYLRKFFDYPVSLNAATIKNLGLTRTFKIGVSYLYRNTFPIKNERSLEDFFINRFGDELYRTFFRDYTEKVWGIPCGRIDASWGAQRVKGLSVSKAVAHALRNILKRDHSVGQKGTETSLIGRFMYPKYGPGQLWNEVASRITEMGGMIERHSEVTGIRLKENRVAGVEAFNSVKNTGRHYDADYFISSMPVKDLINSINGNVPPEVSKTASGLVYRDFITVGLLLDRLKLRNETGLETMNGIIPDNWIYIQERDVRMGRIQVFNNWSPYMVADPDKVWIGLEYFCDEGDDMWTMADGDFIRFAVAELIKIGFIEEEDVIDSTIIRMPKTYPAYFGTYADFSKIREYADSIDNMFLVGRNGTHRYNNMDHSMLSAMEAVKNIKSGTASKDNIWNVNTEEEYHESK